MPIDPNAERTGAAVTLLSLDRVVPHYPAMGLPEPPAAAEALKRSIRALVVGNRAAFVADPVAPPDLRRSLEERLTRDFNEEASRWLLAWLAHDFVHEAADFPYYGTWYQFFSRVQAVAGRWERLALPPGVLDAARSRFAQARTVEDLHDVERRVEAAPLSEWDREMTALHGLYRDGREPYQWVLETVRKRRFVAFLRWFASVLDDADRAPFRRSADALRETIASFDGAPPFPDPFGSIG